MNQTGLAEALQALAEVRALKDAFGANSIVVTRALDRIEKGLADLAESKNVDVKDLYDEIKEFRKEMAEEAKGRALRENATLVTVIMTLAGMVYNFITTTHH